MNAYDSICRKKDATALELGSFVWTCPARLQCAALTRIFSSQEINPQSERVMPL